MKTLATIAIKFYCCNVFVVLTWDAWNQFERSKYSDRPQSSQVHWDVHVCPCCSQDPKQVHTYKRSYANPHKQKTQRRSRIVSVLQMMHMNATILRFIICVELYQKGASHTQKHTKANTHTVGGRLECLDMECEDMRVPSRQIKQRQQQGCIWGFWLFPCVWEDGCDNCYLGREQRKQLHQGKAGHL